MNRVLPVVVIALGWLSGPSALPARQAAVVPAAVSDASLKPLKKQLRRHDAEVARLQRQVSEQEARSREADRRLRQRDQAIEALRRQLQAAQASASGGPGRP